MESVSFGLQDSRTSGHQKGTRKTSQEISLVVSDPEQVVSSCFKTAHKMNYDPALLEKLFLMGTYDHQVSLVMTQTMEDDDHTTGSKKKDFHKTSTPAGAKIVAHAVPFLALNPKGQEATVLVNFDDPKSLLWQLANKLHNFHVERKDDDNDGYRFSPKFEGTAKVTVVHTEWRLEIDRSITETIAMAGDNVNKFGSKNQNSMMVLPPLDSQFQIAWEYLCETDVLGEGEFGVVTRRLYHGVPVAVKTTKPNADAEYFQALLNEIKVRAFIGQHPNIVKFLGAAAERIQEKIVHMVLELSPLGDLESYLRRNSNFLKINDHLTHLMAHWCHQIACGMCHLELNKVVHGDLAARNVLMFPNDVVKITDFGLARKRYQYVKQVTKNSYPLPWRHLAVETLTHMEFSVKTDVWSFGVTVFEIYTLGSIPYAEFLEFSAEFIKRLLTDDKFRLEKPDLATDEIYQSMKQCWDKDPDKRPNFGTLETKFRTIYTNLLSEDPHLENYGAQQQQQQLSNANDKERNSRYTTFEDFTSK